MKYKLVSFLILAFLVSTKVFATETIATNSFGTDIGAQVNATIAANPNGGDITIPAGHYIFTTRIQCPINNNAVYKIHGDTRTSYTTGLGAQVTNDGGTVLDWHGTGSAIDQTITDPNYQWQSLKGCEFSDFTLINHGTAIYSVGISFGGTQDTEINHVVISGFFQGILLQNLKGGTTERYNIQATLENNTYGVEFYAYAGGSNSFGYGKIDINVVNRVNPTSRVVLYIDADPSLVATIYNSEITITGNVFGGTGLTTEQYLFLVGGHGSLGYNKIFLGVECDGTGFCGKDQNWGNFSNNSIIQFLQSYPGTWNNWGSPVS